MIQVGGVAYVEDASSFTATNSSFERNSAVRAYDRAHLLLLRFNNNTTIPLCSVG